METAPGAGGEDGMDLFHHIDVIAALCALQGEADVLVVSDGILLAVHIVREIPLLLCAELGIIHALARIAAAQGIDIGVLPQDFRRLLTQKVCTVIFSGRSAAMASKVLEKVRKLSPGRPTMRSVLI